MAVFLSPVGGAAAQFFNNDGIPLSGGKLYTYNAGTTTPATTYTTSAGSIAHTNPIVLNSAGRIPGGEVWLNATTYKFVLNDSTGALISTYDNISGIGVAAYQVQNFTGDGTTLVFTLSAAPQDENHTSVYINGVYQNKNTYSLTNAAITFTTAPPIYSLIEVMYI